MKKSFWILLAVVVISMLVLAACGGGGGGQATVERKAPPPEYAGKTNPYEDNEAAIAEGKELYTVNCATCHGETGAGDGPAGASLDPKPTSLIVAAKEASEDYVFWIVSEGGAAAGRSASMAAYKGVLTEDEIWKILAYIDTFGK